MTRVWTGHPFDLTKTRLQTAAPGVYKGALDVVRQTLARDGVTGYVFPLTHGLVDSDSLRRLYRGMVPPLLGVTPIFAVSFWVRTISLTHYSSSFSYRGSDRHTMLPRNLYSH